MNKPCTHMLLMSHIVVLCYRCDGVHQLQDAGKQGRPAAHGDQGQGQHLEALP